MVTPTPTPVPAAVPGSTISAGDTAWTLMSTGLVLLMIPALGFFEAGMIRSKNALNVMMQMWTGACVLSVLYYCLGFTLIFGPGEFIGSLKYGFMFNVPVDDVFPEFPTQTIPAFLFAAFQMQFFAITPLLISGAWVERFRWWPFLIFIVGWNLLVYCFVAHWVWGPGGFMMKWGVIDFAGGIVIHTTAGVSSLICALVLGRRAHFGPTSNPLDINEAHNIPMSIMGAALLWFGWFGFNGGSALAANSISTAALFNSHIASATAGVTWLIIGQLREKRASAVGIITGSVGGLACVTPASGYIRTQVAFALGVVAGLASYGSIWVLKEKWRVDDALDVSSVHGLTGMIGSIAAGLFASSTVNSAANYSGTLVGYQFAAVVISGAWAGFWTFVLLYPMKYIPGLKPGASGGKQDEGMDSAYHREVAYKEMDSIYCKDGGSVYRRNTDAPIPLTYPLGSASANDASLRDAGPSSGGMTVENLDSRVAALGLGLGTAGAGGVVRPDINLPPPLAESMAASLGVPPNSAAAASSVN
eukprot:RCo046000